MILKEVGNKFLYLIPHFSELFNMRKNQRYAPHMASCFEIKIKDTRNSIINGKLSDISFDGMKLITSDRRIDDIKTISLSVDDFRVDLPCKKVWQDEYCYRMEFGSMNRREFTKLGYFIEHFIKTAPDNLLELLM